MALPSSHSGASVVAMTRERALRNHPRWSSNLQSPGGGLGYRCLNAVMPFACRLPPSRGATLESPVILPARAERRARECHLGRWISACQSAAWPV